MTKIKTIFNWFQSRLLNRSLDSRYALAEACLIGLVSALSALLLKQGIGWLGLYRLQAAERFGAIWVLPTVGLVFGCLAGLVIEKLSPAAAGGGIPQVKAVLAQFSIPLSLRVALVKLVGTILILGAGLTLGRRGPTVHIGAALAAQLSSWVPNSPEHRRQLIAAGAAAGLAAGFNTPLAGILFVIEELMRDISSLTLETAILASFTGAVVSRWLGSGELNIPKTILDESIPNTMTPSEIPFYLVLGILAGVLGALFNRGILFSLNCNRRLSLSMPLRIGLAGLISGIIIALLPPFFQNNAGLREFLVTSETGDWQTTAEVFVAQFFLTLIAYGSGAPGGIFAPALVLGAALGYLCGNVEMAVLGIGYPQTYALVGMGAFFAAVARVPVTAIVIVFEITADFRLVLPLMVCSIVAYLVGETVFKGSLYQHLLEHNGIELQDETISNSLFKRLIASEVMQRRVETLAVDTSLEETIQAFSRSSYQGFPVLEDNKLVGIVTQTDLSKLSKRKEYLSLREFMTPKPITVSANTPLCDVLYLLDRYKLSHLPVTEGSKLIGIITRGDIIRVEAESLQGSKSFAGNKTVDTKPDPSYLIYQTRSPAVGRG
ncbi:MAG: chloride channel protein, partial [Spirulinaceae cyanobacterium]